MRYISKPKPAPITTAMIAIPIMISCSVSRAPEGGVGEGEEVGGGVVVGEGVGV